MMPLRSSRLLLTTALAGALALPVVAQAQERPQERPTGIFAAFARLLPGQVARQEAEQRELAERGEEDVPVQGPVEATGGLEGAGLPELAVEDTPGERFFTASQAEVLDDDLQRFAVPQDQLVTGSVDDGAQAQSAIAADETVDPWAAVGIRRGPLTWFPAIDLAVGYDSNVDNAANDTRQVRTVRISPSLSVVSDWARHGLNAGMRGTLSTDDDGGDVERSLEADGTLRLDLGLDLTVELRAGYTLQGEAVNDPDAVADADGPTDTHTISAGVGVQHTFGLVDASLAVDVERTLFADTDLTSGGVQDNSDRNRLDGTLALRLQRAEGPLYRPFVEASGTLRQFDERLDRNGVERDSWGYGLRGGFVMADDGPLRGEISVGVSGEHFADATLDDVLALTGAAGLTWDVTGLTSVSLDVETTLDPTTRAGSGVGVNRSARLALSHDLRRNVELRLGAAIDDTQFSDSGTNPRTYTGSAGLTWRTSPVAAFTLDAAYDHAPESDGDVNRLTLEAGVTLQR